MKHLLGLFAFLSLFQNALVARPVSYPHGWTISQKNDREGSMLEAHYSPSIRYSLGLQSFFKPNPVQSWHLVTYNRLLKRHNSTAAQSNVYFLSGGGIAVHRNHTGIAGSLGIAIDYETRRFLIAYENRLIYAERVEKSFLQSGRIGFTPYLARFNSLQPWCILQIDHKIDTKNTITITPLIRLYENNVLIEMGLSLQGNILFNWILLF